MKNVAKYSEKIRQVRKISKKIIPKLLENGPIEISTLIEHMKKQYPDLCNNSVNCECGRYPSSRPEWQHQIRWAIADLKYSEKIAYSNETKCYALI